ncbi:putative dna mismatch repair protein msh4 protein [Botrytis fragariae]|uniref:Putative dna mismatch repair protein msh4 protein n=1 Tax=Botrytis fragariae TaxID=1964551 RepID=A0A8H6END2_9HELO|nr:putative dna mismatch repair protein msh4 protein [Botrytis fragariae]KAF5878538.1 putative dna mismatch repair protein msh4 protein [Botrytis fragariae]
MASLSRPSTAYSTNSASYPCGYTNSNSYSLPPHARRSSTARPSTARPSTGRRSRASSILGGGESQQIICAVSEGRGVSPTVGLAFVNISTGEAVLSQICDNQFYVKTLHKLQVFEPTQILIVSTSGPPNSKSKMYQIVEENILGARIVTVDRRCWSETSGIEYIQQLAFKEDLEAIKVAIGGNYFSVCCFSAALKYIDMSLSLTFAFHSLRVKYQPSEDSMMIDLATIQSLELIQNLQNAKSKDCLFGLMNETLTPMGSRLLRSNILQPSTQSTLLAARYDALAELSENDDMFLQTRQALKLIPDIEKLLTCLIIIPTMPGIWNSEQDINNILMLKSFVYSIGPVFEGLSGARSELLVQIRNNCRTEVVNSTIQFIDEVINEDVTYQKTPLDLRNQRTYAVKAGVSGFLDVARQTFKEATEDVHQHVTELHQNYKIQGEIRFDNLRKYYLRYSESEFDDRAIPDVLVNRFRRKYYLECQTLDLIKLNQKIEDSHIEVILGSDKTIQELLENVRTEIPNLFKVCESIAVLDMIASFGQLVTNQDCYVRPEITDCIAIKSGRHPIRDKAPSHKFVPNDYYATQQSRFQIVTGCNMSGKSTYIRGVALMSVMAQVGCFVPASYASFPMIHQLFARVSMDDSIEANVSTFASEMRETAFILRNIDERSLAIIDELGRGTSTRDGLAIALSIAEALSESRALIWFATHFKELAQIMSERPGVKVYHLSVDMSDPATMTMLYKLDQGCVKEQHYGLTLARVVDLPPKVLTVAEEVSKTLIAQATRRKKSSWTSAIDKRRKLLNALREQLKQLLDSPMENHELLEWIGKLRREFIIRMENIEIVMVDSDTEDENESTFSGEPRSEKTVASDGT